MIRALLLVAGLAILPLFDAAAQQLSVRSHGDQARSQFGGAVAVGEGWAFVGEPQARVLLPEAVYVYRRDGAEWVAADTLTGFSHSEQFGASIAIDGERVFVGAPNAGGTGAAYVYELDEGTWIRTHVLEARTPSSGAGFGTDVDVEGDLGVVGAPFEAGSGAAYVFARQPDGSWVLEDRIVGTRQDQGLFGFSVAVAGTRVVVGAQFSDGQAGVAYSFARKDASGDWVLEQEFVGSEVGTGDRFGRAMDADGDTLVVGSPQDAGAEGAAYAFVRDGSSGEWVETAVLRDGTPERGYFGWSISVDANRTLVGGRASAAAFLFVRDEGGYALEHTIENPLAIADVSFGSAVGLSGAYAIVGAPSAESAVLFEETLAGWEQAALFQGGTYSLPRIEGRVACSNGVAADFPCEGVDLLSFVPIHELGTDGSKRLNDIWGWTDPETGREYALVGRTDGTAFVDVTDPEHPVLLGSLPSRTDANVWRDVKEINDHAVIVADNVGDHGMQIFDLRQLRDVENPPVTFEPTALYMGFGSAHNVVVNEEAGYAYAVGITGPQVVLPGYSCGPGPHIVDMSDPSRPRFAGCYSSSVSRYVSSQTGYTHDAQCLKYEGPDDEHRDKHICLGADETGISITDVTNPESPIELSTASYVGASYTHQGWLTADQRFFLVDDELDEANGVVSRTRTIVFDVADLDDPTYTGEYLGETGAIDHNLYIHEGLVYEANYRAGLRIIDLVYGDTFSPETMREVAYFDVYPRDDFPAFDGAWSSYPFFDSGTILVTGMGSGLFVLRLSAQDVARDDERPDSRSAVLRIHPNPAADAAQVSVEVQGSPYARIEVFDVLGRRVRTLYEGRLESGRHAFALDAAGLPSGVYFVRLHGDGVSETASVTLQR